MKTASLIVILFEFDISFHLAQVTNIKKYNYLVLTMACISVWL